MFAVWLYINWPGGLGNDSLAVFLEITSKEGKFSSGKTAIWVNFVKMALQLFGTFGLVSATQMFVAAVVFSRVLMHVYCICGAMKTIVIAFLFVFAPHVLNFSGFIYPDGLFSICGVGLIFEIWICLKRSKVTVASALFLFLCIPFAVFARSNGLIFLLPIFYLAYRANKGGRFLILGMALFWIVVSFHFSSKQYGEPQGAVYPMVVFETANFIQPKPFSVAVGFPPFNVSDETVDVINRYGGVEKFNQWYDRNYWDSLVHQPDSPQVLRMNHADREILIKEFFRYNLIRNIPAFFASRVNVFMVSALAEGHFPRDFVKQYVIDKFPEFNHYAVSPSNSLLTVWNAINNISWKFRFILWSPFFGIALLFVFAFNSLKNMNIDGIFISTPLIIQLVAIFLLSSAGEYRYLLQYFLLPLIFFPIISDECRTGRQSRAKAQL